MMIETTYLHSSFSGTFPVPCEILGKNEDGFRIRFLDPYLGEWIVRRDVPALELRLPQFGDIVGF